MGLNVSNLSIGDDVVDMPWNGQVIHITIDISRHTPAIERKWRDDNAEQDNIGPFLAQVLRDIVVRWDLMGDVEFDLNDEGAPVLSTGRLIDAPHPFPLELEKLMHLPTVFLGAAQSAVTAVNRPNLQRKLRSVGGFDTEPGSAVPTAPSGTPS